MKTLTFLNKISDNQKESSHIEGWLFPPESFILYSMSRENNDTAGRIVEIGSFLGKSSYWLAKGAQERNGAKVFCVDTFKGSKEHQEKLKGSSTFAVFEANLRKAGVFDWVLPIQKSSEEAFESFRERINLLFIDGSHEYHDVKADLLNWEQYLVKGGIVILHDSAGQWEGPTRVADELIIGRKHTYRDVIRIESMTIAQKTV